MPVDAHRVASTTNGEPIHGMPKLIVIIWTAVGTKCADVRATDTPMHEVLNHRPINFSKIYEPSPNSGHQKYMKQVASSWGPTFLDAFAKLRKASISLMLVTSVCPSSWNNWASNGRILIVVYFSKTVEKLQVSLNFDRNNRYFTWRPIYICDHISLSSC